MNPFTQLLSDTPPVRPTRLVTDTDEEFQAVIARQAKGELVIQAVSVGKGNGQWRFDVWYPAR